MWLLIWLTFVDWEFFFLYFEDSSVHHHWLAAEFKGKKRRKRDQCAKEGGKTDERESNDSLLSRARTFFYPPQDIGGQVGLFLFKLCLEKLHS